MKRLRNWIPALAIIALLAMFFKLPEAPNIFGICKSCTTSNPYQPLIGAGYFALLIAISLLFPAFPGKTGARSGLTWAVLLALTLTYLNLPDWCFPCLIAHLCHMLMWAIWLVVPSVREMHSSSVRERLCLAFLIPISVVALFSSLNLTFMAYGSKPNISATTLQAGDLIPDFLIKTKDSGIVINFISPDCPYCKEQLQVLDAVMSQLANNSYRFINISPSLPSEFVQNSHVSEWMEDKDGKLRDLFKVSGYPTLFVVETDGKISQVISGVPEQLKPFLLACLSKKAQERGIALKD